MESYKLWKETPLFDPAYGQEEPCLIPYFLPGDEVRPCIIVCPGGGYAMRAEDHEGDAIAKMFNKIGYHAVMLRYRVQPYRHPAMQYDVNRAVRYVRYHAEAWKVDPNKIGIIGFSAGGHLVTTSIIHYDYGKDKDAIDEIDRVSCRPNAAILCYAVITMKEYTHDGSCYYLLGADATDEMRTAMSGECNVRDDCPPVFLWHTADDDCVPVQNSLQMATALRAKKIPFELHIFPHGPHGVGLGGSYEDVAQWSKLCTNWIQRIF